MFLNYIKNFFVKKTLNKSFQNLKIEHSVGNIQTVGLLVDGTDFSKVDQLIQLIIKNGFKAQNIKTFEYRDVIGKLEVSKYPIISLADVNWNGAISGTAFEMFSNEKFDLLISFYTIQNPVLMRMTQISKAKFKVGFAKIDERLNHLIINTDKSNYAVFVKEAVKYLNLLNKL